MVQAWRWCIPRRWQEAKRLPPPGLLCRDVINPCLGMGESSSTQRLDRQRKASRGHDQRVIGLAGGCRCSALKLTSDRNGKLQFGASSERDSNSPGVYHSQVLRGCLQGLEDVGPVDVDACLHGGTPTHRAEQERTLLELRLAKQPSSR